MYTPIIILLPCVFLCEAANVTKCYKCEGECKHPEIEFCDNAYDVSCESRSTLYSRQTKKQCVYNKYSEEKASCDKMRESGEVCYRCDTDLCNKDIQGPDPTTSSSTNPTTSLSTSPSTDPSTDRGLERSKVKLSKCYFCDKSCKNPLEIVNCNSSFRKPTCVSVMKGKDVEKDCIDDVNPEKKEKCLADNGNDLLVYSCYYCQTDLCNKGDYEDGRMDPDRNRDKNGVSKCYSCEGECQNPEIEDCQSDKIREISSCVYATLPNDETLKSCYYPSFDLNCDKVIDVGGTCSFCHTDLCNAGKYADGSMERNTAEIHSVSPVLLVGIVNLIINAR